MGGLYQWVAGILCFMIFASAVRAVLPSKKYEKYIRFFTGMVLILVVVQPVMEPFGLEDRLARYFEAIGFQREAQDLKREILGIERQRLEQVIGEYEGAVEQDVRMMAEEMGLEVNQAKVVIERDQDKENYGMVTYVYMAIGDAWDQGTETAWEPIQVGTIEIEPVETGSRDEANEGEEEEGKRAGNTEDAGGGNPDTGNVHSEKQGGQDLEKLRRKVEEYYGLERQEVEIEYKGRQG